MARIKSMKRFTIFLSLLIIVMSSFLYSYFQDSELKGKINGTQETPPASASPEPVKAVAAKNPAKSAFINLKSDMLSPKSIIQAGESVTGPEDNLNISSKDGKYLNLESSQAFPFQRFDIPVSGDLSKKESVQLVWEGSANRIPELYVWDYTLQQWSKQNSDISRDKGNLVLKASINVGSMVKDNTVHALLGTLSKNDFLPGGIPETDNYDFTIAWLTDTQYYSARYPQTFDKMTQYLADNKKDKKISYMIHTGDIVDDMLTKEQWTAADHSLGILEKAGIPYGVTSGNHDVAFDKLDYSAYFNYFGEKRFSGKSYYGGTINNNRDHYDLISSNGMDFVIIYLGWSTDKSSLDWADGILKKYPQRKAIIGTHSYVATRPGYLNNGQQIFDSLVKPNDNVFMVLCGHFFGTASYIKRIGNRVVYELFFNTQSGPEGGSGFLRLFHFDSKNSLIYTNTYSPYLKKYNFYEQNKDQFIIPLTPEHGNIKISTDYVDIVTE